MVNWCAMPINILMPALSPTMTAFNAVRFKVKPGREQEFLDVHRAINPQWPGMRHANIIKTGEHTFCIIAEWDSMDAMAAARPIPRVAPVNTTRVIAATLLRRVQAARRVAPFGNGGQSLASPATAATNQRPANAGRPPIS